MSLTLWHRRRKILAIRTCSDGVQYQMFVNVKPHSHIHDLEHDPNTIKRSC